MEGAGEQAGWHRAWRPCITGKGSLGGIKKCFRPAAGGGRPAARRGSRPH